MSESELTTLLAVVMFVAWVAVAPLFWWFGGFPCVSVWLGFNLLVWAAHAGHDELKKGGLCKLTTERLSFGQCATLNWLLTPKQLRTMR